LAIGGCRGDLSLTLGGVERILLQPTTTWTIKGGKYALIVASILSASDFDAPQALFKWRMKLNSAQAMLKWSPLQLTRLM
jgi:hypothetical protein